MFLNVSANVCILRSIHNDDGTLLPKRSIQESAAEQTHEREPVVELSHALYVSMESQTRN